MMELDRPLVHAPEFPPSTWINAFEPVSLAALRGRAVLIDFWDFTCVNCLRGLPYLRQWHAQYEDAGLTIIGVHTPEFSFAREYSVVKSAVGRLGIRYPVVLDNEQAIWTTYAVSCWPTRVLVDPRGYVRGVRQGEGGYIEFEAALQALLRERDPGVALPGLMAPVRPEDAHGAVCLPTTPELQVDSVAAQLSDGRPTALGLPAERPEGRIYAAGNWQALADGMRLASDGGSVVLPYRAAAVNAVLAAAGPTGAPIDSPVYLDVLQDGRPLPVDRFGEDIRLEEGKARLLVEAPRAYAVVRNPDVALHELSLIIDRAGLTFYAFSFGTCRSNESELDSDPMG